MICPTCGTENPPGRKFCGECGAALAQVCPSCGAWNEPRFKFCGECGTALAAQGPPADQRQPDRAGPPQPPQSERRLVSILFADLVGFTSLSENRDPDEVRDLLSSYFDTCRQLIARYGGTVEKFIGDAVMAVWGTPTAQEDDAERAVRAALDLTAAVQAMGAEVGAADLRARAGVLTGEASVNLGATGEGMVAGDLVNTASRLQTAAPAGAVYVGESTRRATEAAVVYEVAGLHELKGKAEPVQLFRAVRVIGGRGGALRSEGLEAPFVGRDRELRVVKDLLHSTAEEGKAHLVSVIGVAGIGKSRLSWELFKYLDGLQQLMYWHRGRCLSYGEGVTYWALAEMVRGRAGILEGEDQASALPKLRAAVEEHVPDPDERQWVEPRLAHLLGLEERTARDPEDLFSAWRVFFERLAEENPTVLVFEDMQWADPSLLDFIDYLSNWSRSHPLFVMTLARPELVERHPKWGGGTRGVTAMYLEPLSHADMEALLAGLVPGLPVPLRDKILERAQGVPLYAVETVRMLLDRGLLVQDQTAYRLTGHVEDLEVPETLHALIAARLDGLPGHDRQLVQDAAVLGKTFSVAGLAAVSGITETDLDAMLASLVRKEVLTVQADPRSPERGQYGFLQDLVRRVAYETLSKKERKARHLAAAAYLESGWGPEEEEIVEVVASHYVEAYLAAPEAPDAPEIKAKARDALVQAGRRSASLAAAEKALRYYEQAIELADDPLTRADLHERSGQMAWPGAGRPHDAAVHFDAAIEILRAQGLMHAQARVVARLADVAMAEGHPEEAATQMQGAFDVLSAEEPDEDFAALAHQLGRLQFFMGGRSDQAAQHVEVALQIAELLELPGILSQALNTKALILRARGRKDEAGTLLRRALEVSLEHDEHAAALRAYLNLAAAMEGYDQFQQEIDITDRALELARRVGQRSFELKFLVGPIAPLVYLGRWDEALDRAAQIDQLDEMTSTTTIMLELTPIMLVHVRRGELDRAEEMFQPFAVMTESEDVQARAAVAALHAALLNAQGRHADALEAALSSIEGLPDLGLHPAVKEGLVSGIEAALALGDLEEAARLLAIIDGLRPGQRTPYLRAHGSRLGALLSASRGDAQAVEPGFRSAADQFREEALVFFLAVTLLEWAEWLGSQGRRAEAEPLLDEAQPIFERLRATPWLDRVAKTAPPAEREEPAEAAHA